MRHVPNSVRLYSARSGRGFVSRDVEEVVRSRWLSQRGKSNPVFSRGNVSWTEQEWFAASTMVSDCRISIRRRPLVLAVGCFARQDSRITAVTKGKLSRPLRLCYNLSKRKTIAEPCWKPRVQRKRTGKPSASVV